MEKKNILKLGLFLMILTVVGGFGYSIYQDMNSKDVKDDNTTDDSSVITEIDKDSLKLEYNYVDENLWRYSVVGTLPNFCYTVGVSAVVMESYPEQVVVTTTVYQPEEDEICTDTVQEIHEEGEFVASESAEVRFEIKEEEKKHIEME